MTKPIRIILIVLIVLILSAAFAMIINKSKIDKTYNFELSVTPKPTIAPPELPFNQSKEVLKSGSVGVEVIRLQERLIELKYLAGKADGQFGQATKNALIEFQQNNDLEPDGIAGENTLDKLYSKDAKKNK